MEEQHVFFLLQPYTHTKMITNLNAKCIKIDKAKYICANEEGAQNTSFLKVNDLEIINSE